MHAKLITQSYRHIMHSTGCLCNTCPHSLHLVGICCCLLSTPILHCWNYRTPPRTSTYPSVVFAYLCRHWSSQDRGSIGALCGSALTLLVTRCDSRIIRVETIAWIMLPVINKLSFHCEQKKRYHRRRNINLSGGAHLTLFAPYIHDNSFENNCIQYQKIFSKLTWLASSSNEFIEELAIANHVKFASSQFMSLELVYVWILSWQVEWNLGSQNHKSKNLGAMAPLAPLVPPPMVMHGSKQTLTWGMNDVTSFHYMEQKKSYGPEFAHSSMFCSVYPCVLLWFIFTIMCLLACLFVGGVSPLSWVCLLVLLWCLCRQRACIVCACTAMVFLIM